MGLDATNFSLAKLKPGAQPAGPGPGPASQPASDAAQMAGDQLKLAIRKAVDADLDENLQYRIGPVDEFKSPNPLAKLKGGLGVNLDENTRLGLDVSLKKGGSFKIKFNKKF